MPEDLYQLPDAAYEEWTWVYENEHNPGSHPPLTQHSLFAGRTPADGLPGSIFVGGYTYMRLGRNGQPVGFGGMRPPEDLSGTLELWEDVWRPQVATLAAEIDAFEPESVAPGAWRDTLDAQAQEFGRVFAGVHMQTVVPAGMAGEQFLDQYAARLGEERRDDGLALLQGFPNRTLDRAAGLWRLGRLAARDPELHAALGRGLNALPESGAARQFVDAFEAFLDEFGLYVDQGLQDLPTWREDPAPALAMIRAYAQQREEDDPAFAAARQRERRLALEMELKAMAPEMLGVLRAAQAILPVRENHNMICDQQLVARSRLRWLRVGDWARAQARLTAAADVFFHTRDELLAVLEGGEPLASADLAARRARQATFRATPPPPVLGPPPGGPGLEHAATGTGAPGPRTLRGTAACGGIYTGRARVIRDLEHAASLAPGDVLVCTVTSPPWTPYFAVIGAVVTEAGGALSHPAIVAREYGLPAVLSVRGAVTAIPDGATITVDGSTGVVIVN